MTWVCIACDGPIDPNEGYIQENIYDDHDVYLGFALLHVACTMPPLEDLAVGPVAEGSEEER